MSQTDVLDGFWTEGEEQPQAAPVAEAPPAPQPEPERPQEPAQPAPAEEPAPAPAPPALDEGVVKALDGRLEATLRERDKRQDAERRAQAAEAELQRYRAQQQPVQAPNPFDDPEGFASHQQQQFESRLLAERFAMSDAIARTVHGDKVDPAVEWAMQQANTVPGFADQYVAQKNPVDWAVKQHRQHQLVSQLGDAPDLDQAFEKWAAEKGFVKADTAPAALAVASPSTPPQQPARAPRSIVSAPSAGGKDSIPIGPLAGFEDLLKR